MKSFCCKSMNYFFRNIPAVTKKIGHYRRNRQLLCNVLYNVNLGNGLIVHYKSIIQDNTITGQHNSNGLMPVILLSF